jgi:hypothetical protein
LTVPEALEACRFSFGTSALLGRWLQWIGPYLAATDPRLLFNMDESMIAFSSRCKVIVKPDERAFQKKKPKGPHLTAVLTTNPVGQVPPPTIILPGLANLPDELTHFRDLKLCNFLSSPTGWINSPLSPRHFSPGTDHHSPIFPFAFSIHFFSHSPTFSIGQ